MLPINFVISEMSGTVLQSSDIHRASWCQESIPYTHENHDKAAPLFLSFT